MKNEASMKILLLHQFFVLESEPGGTRHIFLSRFFQKKGGEVSVIAGSVNYMTGRSRLSFFQFRKKEIVDGVRITWVYAFPTLKYGVLGKLLCYFSFFLFSIPFVFRERTDVLIATTPPPTVVFLGWIFHLLKKVPWILEIRDLWPEMITDLGTRFGPLARSFNLFAGLFSRLMNFLYHQATFVVSLTFGIEKGLVGKGISADRITTIPNGVDPIFLFENQGSLSPPGGDLRLPLKKEGMFWVVYLGSMGMVNPLETILQVAENFKSDPRIEFVFVGDGACRKKLILLANEKGLTNTKFLEAVPRVLVPRLLDMADVCIHILPQTPSFRIALPNRLFDYMASRKPVLLCFEKGDASQVLEEAGAGVQVSPDDIPSIRKWILYFLDNPGKAREMGESGKAYVLRNFLREDLAGNYYRVLERLAGPG